MKHHQHHPGFPFVKEPVGFQKSTEKALLQYCLGATLYMPGTKNIVEKVVSRQFQDLTSMVMDFEDAISESEVTQAEENVLRHLERISEAAETGQIPESEIPLIFLRVRNPQQFRQFAARLDARRARALTGFVFPKFYSNNALEYFEELDALNVRLGVLLYGMPILEGRTIAFRETRMDELGQLKSLLHPFRERILNIRVGGTDFSSLFGVRRGMNSSIYDILTVRDCLSDILNFFNRAEEAFTVSAPVWEYFLAYKKDDIERLLQTNLHRSLVNKEPIVNDAIDGLLREVLLDKANGFVGKTVIHPSHVKLVNAMQAVTREEYDDAQQILNGAGGVVKSARSNKMNEINPHRNWATRVARRAQAFGVVENETDYVKLFTGAQTEP